ncbi:MAG: hypothetical protein QM811_07440 [Pirellulales bacterium]
MDGIPRDLHALVQTAHSGETASIVEYVLFLSMRGQFEDGLAKHFNTDFSKEAETDAIKGGTPRSDLVKSLTSEVEGASFAEDTLDPLVEGIATNWTMSQTDDPTCRVFVKSEGIPSTRESIDKGRVLFLSDNAGCSKCHGQAGRGDGPSTTAVNAEGTLGLVDSWGNPIMPRTCGAGSTGAAAARMTSTAGFRWGSRGLRCPGFARTRCPKRTAGTS